MSNAHRSTTSYVVVERNTGRIIWYTDSIEEAKEWAIIEANRDLRDKGLAGSCVRIKQPSED